MFREGLPEPKGSGGADVGGGSVVSCADGTLEVVLTVYWGQACVAHVVAGRGGVRASTLVTVDATAAEWHGVGVPPALEALKDRLASFGFLDGDRDPGEEDAGLVSNKEVAIGR